MELTPKAMIAAQALAEGATRAQAAKAAGVSEPTITRWKREDDFKDAVEDILRELLQSNVPEAIRTLGELLHSDNPWLRLNAAREILTRADLSFERAEKEIAIRVIGGPELGQPDSDEYDA